MRGKCRNQLGGDMKMETRIKTGAMDSICTSPSECERKQQFEVLLAKHGIDTVMVSIPRIARALGYAPATLYGYIKNGDFFLPYRVVQGSPMVAVDDFINWCCSRQLEVTPGNSRRGHKQRVRESASRKVASEIPKQVMDEEVRLSERELIDQETSTVLARAISRLGIG